HTGVILIEHHFKARLRPYHAQRLALQWANLRHFALELARAGRHVSYHISTEPLRTALDSIAASLGITRLAMMTPAERETRADLAPLIDRGLLALTPHEGWLTTRQQFDQAHAGLKGSPRWKMDSFYRHVRRETGILMQPDGTYVGGKVSFDTDNRLPWSGRLDEPRAAEPPTFTPDDITREVIDMIRRDFASHPGAIDPSTLPATDADAAALWAWAKRACLHNFGPYEDAMSVRSRTVFHTRISALVNLHRLLPCDIIRDAEAADIPLQSKEGFIRQILGWREFVKHVHDATDGFRTVTTSPTTTRETSPHPGDGGYAIWANHAWSSTSSTTSPPTPATLKPLDLPGAAPAILGGTTPLPPAYWHGASNNPSPPPSTASGMNCLDHVVQGVWAEAYSHHITRLMILANIATLLDVSPRQLTDWFWVAYADAWDWVVEPNVLAMGTYAVGDVMTTKPYISGSAYIDKMSDYCSACPLDPATTCPITRLYWAFLARHEPTLKSNPRLMMPMRSLAKRAATQRAADQRVFIAVRDVLIKGQRITPDLVQRAIDNATPPFASKPSPKPATKEKPRA
ncbi:MAG: cryptochrome/photolyase family protein, partial [Phycisphaerales bacterium]|nr:cryptochrome/photolyase family protein [Phycisphaerales bacterium]